MRARSGAPEPASGCERPSPEGWINNLELTYPGADWDYNILDAPGLDVPEHASIAELAEAAGMRPLELSLT